MSEGEAAAESPVDRAADAAVPSVKGEAPPEADLSGARPAAPAPVKRTPWLVIALAAAGVGALVFAVAAKKDGSSLEVAGHEWRRSVDIEKLTQKKDSGWCYEMPADATDVTRRSEVKEQKQVIEGETCTDSREVNGSRVKVAKVCVPKYRSEAVYADRCDYTLTRWTKVRGVTAEGGLADPRIWPEAPLLNPGTDVGCEREGARSETYVVHFKDVKTGKPVDCEYDESRWGAFVEGRRARGKSSRASESIDCNEVEP